MWPEVRVGEERPAGLRFGVFIKKALVRVLHRHQNVVHQTGVHVRFVCDVAAHWLRLQTSLCVSWTPKKVDFWTIFSRGGLRLRVSNRSVLRPVAI